MSKETKNTLISIGVILMFLFLTVGMLLSLNAVITNKPLMEVIYGSKK